MNKTLLKLKNSFALAFRIIISVLITAVIIWKFKYLQNLDVRALIESCSSLPITLATILGVYFVKGIVLVVPASLVYIAVGMSIKIGWALAVNTVGIIVEITATYILGLILGGPFVTKKLKETKYGEKLFNIYDKYEKTGILLIRLLGLPIDFCSLFFGAMRARFIPYLLMSLAGILPRVILFTILGDKVYGLIPMKYVIPVAAVLLVAALIIWTFRSAIKSGKNEENFGKPAYTPLCETPGNIIIDTDIGPDCDDAGALAIAFKMAHKYNCKILGICNCTSNPYANGTIRAISSFYGHDDIFVGQHKGFSLLPDNSKFNKKITSEYCKYENSSIAAQSEIEFYKKLLKNAEDKSVTVITLGMFTNISAILNEDAILFNKKVRAIVSMAGKKNDKEFNIEKDPISAANTLEKYKGMIVFSDYETGEKVLTGFENEVENNPVYDCYKLHTGKKSKAYNSSFDLTAVQYAFEGNSRFYSLSKPMSVSISADGTMKVKKDKFAQNYFIKKESENDDIASYLNNILNDIPEEDLNEETEITDNEKAESNENNSSI